MENETFYSLLSQNLAEQLQGYEQLYQLAFTKRKSIINNQMESLAKLIQEEKGLMQMLNQLEEVRQRIMGTTTATTLHEVLSTCPDPVWHNRLLEQQHQLVQSIEQLRQLNEQNQDLIEESLHYLEKTITEVTAAPEEDLFYGPQSVGGKRHLFDSKA
ncbi:flagellar protein FlgN [Rubeoparvulum massiliense]|uniref:flagellar protein FlgN n=1 Tax=Rubeoparvulum massiliense TaxID=1631346 RepID=UPI00065E40AA|nr:flagellar protein FlgN [Rubeoparvulum massiliense]